MKVYQLTVRPSVPAGSIPWKRAGLAGFTFFLLKGLMWLIAPLTLYISR